MRAAAALALSVALALSLALTFAVDAHADSSVPGAGGGAKLVCSLQRTACFGWCPVYQITVLSDGTMKYVGTNFVKQTGERTVKLTPAQLASLRAAFGKADYFSFADRYEHRQVTDNPSTFTSYSDGTRQKSVSHYHGDHSAPEALGKLEDEIDRIVQIDRLIGTRAEREHLRR